MDFSLEQSPAFTVKLNIGHLQLLNLLRRRASRFYFQRSYASARDLRDLCGSHADIEISGPGFSAAFERVSRRLKAHLGNRIILSPGILKEIIACRRLSPAERTAIIKSSRDFMLHSIASEILSSIHPGMADLASRKGIKALMRLIRLTTGKRYFHF